jgi:DNA-binding Lrp family transcriptional regulator
LGGREEERKLLFELIKNSARSDRELARSLNVSQPTVSRKRKALEKEGLILEYTVIPNLDKMGYQIAAFTFMAFSEDKPELFDKAREWTKKQPSVVFATNGEGLGMNSMMVSIHKDYASYSQLMTQLRRDWQPNLKDTQSFIVSLPRHELFIKQFSFKHLEASK